MPATRNDEVDGGNQLSGNIKKYTTLQKTNTHYKYLWGPESSAIHYLQHM